MYILMHFTIAIPDVVLIGIHIKPSTAELELDALVKVYEETVQSFTPSTFC